MKPKLSITLDESLVSFVDSEAGSTRSEKIEMIVRRYREAHQDAVLRRALMDVNPTADDEAESDDWRLVMEKSQWNESDAATSRPSRSPRSRNRGRR